MNPFSASFTRREFLTQSLPLSALAARRIKATDPAGSSEEDVFLDSDHTAAVHRRRRIVMMQDAYGDGHQGEPFAGKFEDWLAYRFDLIDQTGNQVDSVWWDMAALDACYPSRVLPPHQNENLQRFRDRGIDCLDELVSQTRQRGLEVFWNHRISEVELDGNQHPLKKMFPDWVVKTWWPHGMWNLAADGVRDMTVAIITELAENYPLDGIQIDFARHTPVLPPGHQWELREHVTQLIRRVRLALLKVATQRSQPMLLAVRVPGHVEGCRADGFDVEAWAQQRLVDIFTIGTRTIDVDIEGFHRLCQGRDIHVMPCWDDHHAMDAYQWQSVEFLRGVYSNWWHRGADSVATWNWSNARAAVCQAMGSQPGPVSQEQALAEIGSPDTLRLQDKVFAVDRRGGFPWSEGYFSRNAEAPLPVELSIQECRYRITIRMEDQIRDQSERIQSVVLRLIFSGIKHGNNLETRLNGKVLNLLKEDFEHKDNQILSPSPQPNSGRLAQLPVDPHQRLLRLDFACPVSLCRVGINDVEVRLPKSKPELFVGTAKLEKVECHVAYTG